MVGRIGSRPSSEKLLDESRITVNVLHKDKTVATAHAEARTTDKGSYVAPAICLRYSLALLYHAYKKRGVSEG